MKKKSLRIVSAILSFVMVFLLMPFGTITVTAQSITSIDKMGKLGYGFNMLGDDYLSSSNVRLPIFTSMDGINADFASDSYTTTNFTYISSMSSYIENGSKEWNASLDANVRMKLVALDIKGKFGMAETTSSSDSEHSEMAIIQVLSRRGKYEMVLGEAQIKRLWNKDANDKYTTLNEDFVEALLTYSPEEFFALYGTHIITAYSAGGEAYASYQGRDLASTSSSSNEWGVDATVQLSTRVALDAKVGFDFATSSGNGDSTSSTVKQTSTKVTGGTGFSLENILSGGEDVINDWLSSLNEDTIQILSDDTLKLLPVWELLYQDEYEDRRTELEEYFIENVNADYVEFYNDYIYNPAGVVDYSGYTFIKTEEDFANIANDLAGQYVLLNNIDLGGAEWSPIGTEERPFIGILDGNGNTISGLSITKTTNGVAGLFGYNSGTIRNLTVSGNIDADATGSENNVAYIGGIVGYNKGRIENCVNIVEVNGQMSITDGESVSITETTWFDNNKTAIEAAKNTSASNTYTVGTTPIKLTGTHDATITVSGTSTQGVAYIVLEDAKITGTIISNGRDICIISIGTSNTITGSTDNIAVNASNSNVYICGEAPLTIIGGNGSNGRAGIDYYEMSVTEWVDRWDNGTEASTDGAVGKEAVVAINIEIDADNVGLVGGNGGIGGKGESGVTGDKGAEGSGSTISAVRDGKSITQYAKAGDGKNGSQGQPGSNGGTGGISAQGTIKVHNGMLILQSGDGGTGGMGGTGGRGGPGGDGKDANAGGLFGAGAVEGGNGGNGGNGGAGGKGGDGGESGGLYSGTIIVYGTAFAINLDGIRGAGGQGGTGGEGGRSGFGGSCADWSYGKNHCGQGDVCGGDSGNGGNGGVGGRGGAGSVAGSAGTGGDYGIASNFDPLFNHHICPECGKNGTNGAVGSVGITGDVVVDYAIAKLLSSTSEYTLYTNAKTWEDAKSEAGSAGETLVSIGSAAEQTLIEKLISTTTPNQVMYWIGLQTQDFANGKYLWEDGSCILINGTGSAATAVRVDKDTGEVLGDAYVHFATGEPNNSGSAEMYMHTTTDYFWNDVGETKTLGYITEKSLAKFVENAHANDRNTLFAGGICGYNEGTIESAKNSGEMSVNRITSLDTGLSAYVAGISGYNSNVINNVWSATSIKSIVSSGSYFEYAVSYCDAIANGKAATDYNINDVSLKSYAVSANNLNFQYPAESSLVTLTNTTVTESINKYWDNSRLVVNFVNKTDYLVAQEFDETSLDLSYNDSSVTSYTVRYNFYQPGTSTATVVYENGGNRFVRYIPVYIAAASPVSIELYGIPKVEFIFGDEFTYKGLSVKLNYDNDTYKLIPSKNITVSEPNMSLIGEQQVNVSYTPDEGITYLTCEYPISISAVAMTSLQIVKTPDKTTYWQGETLDTTGLLVQKVMNNGTTEEISLGNSALTINYDFSAVGTQTVTISYNEFNAAFDCTVKAVEVIGIDIIQEPYKTTYVEGATLNTDGLKVQTVLSNGDVSTITGDNSTLSYIYDFSTEGVKTVTVKYGNYTDSFTCEVYTYEDYLKTVTKVTVESVKGCAGNTVTVDMVLDNNTGILAAALSINYDSALMLIDANGGEALSSLTLTKPGSFVSPCTFAWDGINDADATNGIILTLTFVIPEDAVSGDTYEISVAYTEGNVINDAFERVELATISGEVTVIDYVPGDLNGDSVVNMADVVNLRRYIVGGYDLNINLDAADVNNDGSINMADVVLIRRYVVGGYGVVLQ